MTDTGHVDTSSEPLRPPLPEVFPSLAFLFGPADPSVRSTVVEAEPHWTRPSIEAVVDVVLWGRLARNERASLGLLPGALRREAAMAGLRAAPPAGFRLAELHRLPAVRRPGRLRGPVRAALLSGVLAELVRGDRPTRVIDAVVAEAGGSSLGSGLRPSGDGSALATLPMTDGSSAELRVSRIGHPKDPQRGRAALQTLESAGIPLVPRPLGAGTTAGAAWATETALPGTHTIQLTPVLLKDITDLLVQLPAVPAPMTAVDDQLREVALAFPENSEALESLAAAVRRWSASMAPVLVHGDMWLNNILVAGGRLSGVFDWETWHPAGIPGTDLLNLLAVDERTRTRLDFGTLLIGDYWRSTVVLEAFAPYVVRRGMAMPDEAGLAAIGVAWWASRLAASLDRGARPTEDPDWVDRNLLGPLDRLERLERELG
jgi:phosphotransferase family enzyme